jgi:hypothetical protein
MNRATTTLGTLVATITVATATASAQVTVVADQTFGAGDPQSYDALGYGLAVDGTVMLSAARGSDTIVSNGGAVYAFVRTGTGWQQSQKIVFPNAQAGDEIGTALALRGAVGVAGAPLRGPSGRAFVLRFDGGAWFSLAELSDPTVSAAADFGAAVACTPDTIAVGAPAATQGVGANAGRVRLFQRSGTQWNAGPVLAATFPDPGDRFGFAIAMDGPWLAISAPGDDEAAVNAGAVWVYRLTPTGYELRTRLACPLPPATALEAGFGQSVAISGSTLVVGASQADTIANASGAAFRYQLSTKGVSLVSTLLPPLAPSAAADAQFGFSVATDGSAIVVGAPGLVVSGQLRGGAFLYLNGTALDGVLANPGPAGFLLAGTRVACTGTSVIASAPTANAGLSTQAGRLYVLDRTRDCDASGTPDAIELANGILLDGNGDGIPDDCQCLADLNGNGQVNSQDLSFLLAFWGTDGSGAVDADINNDGIVNAGDLAALLAAWGPC